jgi:hypothetical protein
MKFRAVLPFAAVGASLLSACATTPAETPQREAKPRQPLPAEVAGRLEGVRAERDRYPTFRDIPLTPTDVRTPVQFRQAVQAIKGDAAEISATLAGIPIEIPNPESYAQQARRELGVGPEDVPPPDQVARIEALARELRRRAEPPPPIVD